MLFRVDALERIRSGRVSVVFRRWRQARVRAGTRLRTAIGLIKARPATRAGDLYAAAGCPDVATFKRDVRRLKELGLTESLEVGYRLSPRGAAVAARMPETSSPSPYEN